MPWSPESRKRDPWNGDLGVGVTHVVVDLGKGGEGQNNVETCQKTFLSGNPEAQGLAPHTWSHDIAIAHKARRKP